VADKLNAAEVEVNRLSGELVAVTKKMVDLEDMATQQETLIAELQAVQATKVCSMLQS
jgi:hypothetical protein